MLPWEQFAAHLAHGLLYVLIFAAPVSGWPMSLAEGFQTVWFGLIPLPDPIGKDRELARLLGELQRKLNYLMLAIACAHALAALKHHFVERDDVLLRMIPPLRRSPDTPGTGPGRTRRADAASATHAGTGSRSSRCRDTGDARYVGANSCRVPSVTREFPRAFRERSS